MEKEKLEQSFAEQAQRLETEMKEANVDKRDQLQKHLQELRSKLMIEQESLALDAKESDAITEGIVSNHRQELAIRDNEIHQLIKEQEQVWDEAQHKKEVRAMEEDQVVKHRQNQEDKERLFTAVLRSDAFADAFANVQNYESDSSYTLS